MADYQTYFQAVLRPPSEHMTEDFFALSGRYSNFQKETYFIRYVSKHEYGNITDKLRLWQEDAGARCSGHVFVPALPKQPDQAELEQYIALYHQGNYKLPFSFENRILEEAFETNFREILQLFQKSKGRVEESIIRNFVIKMLYWIDRYFPLLFTQTKKIAAFPKFVCSGTVKLPEYLFLYLLYRMGCDVLYLGKERDVCVEDADLLRLSVYIEAPEKKTEPIAAAPAVVPGSGENRPVRAHSPRPQRAPAERPVSGKPADCTPPASGEKQPMEYEELAKMASSVVMLQVFDAQNQCFKTGSGVIINESGYILTNFHVVSGGRYYGVLLEEEPDVFYTDELIKYHPDLDLAILRMNKRRRPIPVWRGETPLVRGQKVVAIGSPLGLFNTVSDGIISGFRTVGAQTMIQFTAPTSHGSSGGALLDLYGNLIGIITAGFDDGQNLNLAVDYQTILEFSRGLLTL